jgi:hypothetical protein
LARVGVVFVVLAALAVSAAGARAATAGGGQRMRTAGPTSGPLSLNGMWIWYVSRASGGKVSAILATARRYHVGTLMIKSGDGSQRWSQFSPKLLSALHAGGLQVCAWQYVYGTHPIAEAKVGAAAVHAGADCLLIDAEMEYQGKYVQAQKYIRELRHLIGPTFPVGLASFPYVDYHPSFPYSVFLGPGGAQYNLPQMYWRDIGTSVDGVFAHTYLFNRIYLRPIYPLGQVYNAPPAAQISRFRQFLRVYGAVGVSWWDWADATLRSWRAVSQWVPYLANASAAPGEATLSKGAAGDLVVWAQEHLRAAGQSVAVDGGFGKQTVTAVRSFQLAHGLIADGVIGSETWNALVQYKPAYVNWGKPRSGHTGRMPADKRLTAAAVAAADTRAAAPRSGTATPPPASALLPDRAQELPGSPGAGRP